MKQSISGGWYLAFFVIGILLGLLALHLLGGRDPLQSLLPPAAEESSTVAAHPPAQHSTPSHHRDVHKSSGRPRAKTEPSKPPASDPSAQAAAAVAVAPAAPAPRHEPLRCDIAAARAVRDKAREVAEITDYSDHLNVKLLGEWAYYSESVRRSFVQKFADSDACLNGQSRPIEYFYQGKRFAYADPDKGVSFQ